MWISFYHFLHLRRCVTRYCARGGVLGEQKVEANSGEEASVLKKDRIQAKKRKILPSNDLQ